MNLLKIFSFSSKASQANQKMQDEGVHDKNNTPEQNYKILKALGYVWNATAGVFVKGKKKDE